MWIVRIIKSSSPRGLVRDVLSSTAQPAPPSRTCALWGILLHSWAIFLCLPEKTTSLSQSSPHLLSQPAIFLVLMHPCHSCQGWDYKCTRYPALIWCQDLLEELWKTFSIAGSWPCCPSSQISAITTLLFLSVSCWPVLIFWFLFWRGKHMYFEMEMRTLAVLV